ncbi:MAG: crotonase/enoyl-CoA hydratase family protein [Acidimicrobiales bacterium]
MMTEAAESAVLVERHDRTLLITLNRPDAMNAINQAISDGLVAAVKRLDEDRTLTVGVLTGNGRGFCAGMDLKAYSRGENIGPFKEFVLRGSAKPLIAAVEGFALAGGLELVLTCDLLVAAKGVKLGIPEAKVGLFAAAGGLARLPSRVGYAKAMEMALTGEPITAEAAFEAGFVARLSKKGRAVETAMELAGRVSANAPLAVATSRDLIRATIGSTENEYWEIQERYRDRVFSSHDSKEGPLAFAEKRPPIWTGE